MIARRISVLVRLLSARGGGPLRPRRAVVRRLWADTHHRPRHTRCVPSRFGFVHHFRGLPRATRLRRHWGFGGHNRHCALDRLAPAGVAVSAPRRCFPVCRRFRRTLHRHSRVARRQADDRHRRVPASAFHGQPGARRFRRVAEAPRLRLAPRDDRGAVHALRLDTRRGTHAHLDLRERVSQRGGFFAGGRRSAERIRDAHVHTGRVARTLPGAVGSRASRPG